MRFGKLMLGLLGGVLALVAIALLVGGGALVWAMGTHQSSDGFLISTTEEVATGSYALTSSQLDLGALRTEWVPTNWLATIQVNAAPTGDPPVFVGIGPESDVRAYLEDVAHAEVTKFSEREVTYRHNEGDAVPASPSGQDFWVVSNEGSGSISWDIEPGDWRMVIMNADATPEVAVDVSLGVKTPWLAVLMVGLLVVGVGLAALAAVMMFFGFRVPRAAAAEVAPSVASTVGAGSGSMHDTA
ncbi:MAG TPA: hypothetical protein VM848_10250 [Acidimicrobiia bacterium]|nr:hypothetical protein [Acidimicrobiia bacterium]